MSNFSIFKNEYLLKLIQPFAPSMAQHITPIKYEALTPDIFMLLFRTTDHNGQDHFFVSMETDYIESLESARCIIEDWHGSLINFWSCSGKEPTDDTTSNKDEYSIVTAEPYYALLAEVKSPTHKGYWSEATTIMPGDNIGEKIKHYTKKEQQKIRKTLTGILQKDSDASMPFHDSYIAKYKNTIENDINQTNVAVSLYLQPNGNVEYFYNFVKPTIGGNQYKSSDTKK